MFKEGQKVICIGEEDRWILLKKIWFFTFEVKYKGVIPKNGKIYTCTWHGIHAEHNVYCCRLLEIDGLFESKWFKPAQEDFAEEVCENAIKEAKEEEKQLIEELTNI